MKNTNFDIDARWHACLRDAAELQSGAQLRRLYCTIVAFRNVAEPVGLFEAFEPALSVGCDKILRDNGVGSPDAAGVAALCRYIVMQLLAASAFKHGADTRPDLQLLQARLTTVFATYRIPELLPIENDISDVSASQVETLHDVWPWQEAAFGKIRDAVEDTSAQTKAFFLYGPPQVGKTFVLNQLQGYARTKGKRTLTMASSVGAISVLSGGRSAETTVKQLLADTTFGRDTDVVLWDDCTHADVALLEQLDAALRFHHQADIPFGGKVVVLAGDWCQGHRGSRCLHSASIWNVMVPFHLAGRRIDAADEDFHEVEGFSDWTASIGFDGSRWLRNPNRTIVPPKFQVPSAEQLLRFVYGDFDSSLGSEPSVHFAKRVIIAADPADRAGVNDRALASFPGVMRNLEPTFSFDDATRDETGPAIRVKVNVPISLLRDVDPKLGLNAGTRLLLLAATPNVLMAAHLDGKVSTRSTTVFVPRDLYTGTRGEHWQFPIRLAFTMPLDCVRGQTFDRVGLDLRTSLAEYGELFTAVSRTTRSNGLAILLPQNEQTTAAVNPPDCHQSELWAYQPPGPITAPPSTS